MLHLSHQFLFPLLFLTGLTAGMVDAIAGGGGLVSLPVLLGVGIPPHLALGTNKLQATVGTFMAARSYHKHGWMHLKVVYKGLISGFVGAVSGALASQILSSQILSEIIPVLMVIILMYTLLSPAFGVTDRKPRIFNEFWFYILFGFGLGFYDGFFGPSTGSLWFFALTFFLGYNLTKASAYAKVFNLKSNLIATACFALGHNIDYRLAAVMALGQLFGGRIGAHLVIKKGAALIRPIFITVVSITIVSLVYRNLRLP